MMLGEGPGLKAQNTRELHLLFVGRDLSRSKTIDVEFVHEHEYNRYLQDHR